MTEPISPSRPRSAYIAMAALCVAGGCRWMLDAALPQVASTTASSACACAIVAAGLWLLSRGRTPRPAASASALSPLVMMLCGAGIFAAPALGDLMHGAAADSFDHVVSLCFVPLLAVVGRAASPRTSHGLEHAQLWPALAAIAAALAIFPLLLPRSVWAVAGLLLPPLLVAAGLTAAADIWPRRLVSAPWLSAGACLALAVIALTSRSPQPPSPLAVIADAVLIALGIFVAVTADGLLYAARFVAVPLVTIGTSAVIERPGWSARLVAGIALFAFATAGLMRSTRSAAASASLTLRG